MWRTRSGTDTTSKAVPIWLVEKSKPPINEKN